MFGSSTLAKLAKEKNLWRRHLHEFEGRSGAPYGQAATVGVREGGVYHPHPELAGREPP